MSPISSLIAVAVILAFNYIPSIIAFKRRKRNKIAILALNVITMLIIALALLAADDGGSAFLVSLIVMLLFWVITFIWSLLHDRKEAA